MEYSPKYDFYIKFKPIYNKDEKKVLEICIIIDDNKKTLQECDNHNIISLYPKAWREFK